MVYYHTGVDFGKEPIGVSKIQQQEIVLPFSPYNRDTTSLSFFKRERC